MGCSDRDALLCGAIQALISHVTIAQAWKPFPEAQGGAKEPYLSPEQLPPSNAGPLLLFAWNAFRPCSFFDDESPLYAVGCLRAILSR